MERHLLRISLASLFIIIFTSQVFAVNTKIRLYGTGSTIFTNEIYDDKGAGVGGGIALAYAVKPKSRAMNTELSIVVDYNKFPFEEKDEISLLRFGWGLRMLVNHFKVVRPYFAHEITSQVVKLESLTGYANTFQVTLGLGVDIPVLYDNIDEESSSIFFDVAYNSFNLGYFKNPEPMAFKFLSINLGFSLCL